MNDQMTVGRTVRLKHEQHISTTLPGGNPELTVVLSGGHYKILGIEGDDKLRVQGIGQSTPRGEYVWPITAFELVDEVGS